MDSPTRRPTGLGIGGGRFDWRGWENEVGRGGDPPGPKLERVTTVPRTPAHPGERSRAAGWCLKSADRWPS